MIIYFFSYPLKSAPRYKQLKPGRITLLEVHFNLIHYSVVIYVLRLMLAYYCFAFIDSATGTPHLLQIPPVPTQAQRSQQFYRQLFYGISAFAYKCVHYLNIMVGIHLISRCS